jgi:outer membrane lipoprotein-sorting protein
MSIRSTAPSAGARTPSQGLGRGALVRAAAVTALLVVASGAAAEGPADEVLAAARGVSASVKDKTMRVRMRILEPDGSERERTLRGYEKKTELGRRILWVFDSPMELAGTGFLAWQEGGGEDQLWIYFPGQRRVRRIPPSLRRENFQGSAFTFEDLTAIFYVDYEGRSVLEGEEPCGEARCQLLQTDLPEGEFAYRRIKSWVRTDDHVPVRVEFFDDGLLKILKVLRVEEIEGVPTVVEMEMESPRDAFKTKVEFFDVDYNQDLADSIFTVGYLSQTGK